MALSDVQQWQTVGVDANTIAIIPCQESAAGTVWDNFEGDTQWDVTPASGNEPQIESTSLPNANFTYAKIFDNNDYAQTANPAEFPTGDMTVEFMLFIDDEGPADTEGIICIYPTSAGQRNLYINRGVAAAADKIYFGISDDGTTFDDVITTSALSRGAWHYVACVFDASTSLTIYVDGSQAGQNTTSIDASIFNSNQPITYGGYNSTWLGNNAFDGRVTDIRISNKARTTAEIEAHWAGTDGGAPASGPAKLKTWNTITKAKLKTLDTIAIAKMKTIDTIA